ncbi:hypothetical protein BGLA2_990010 [Burkholderia gladioli]|nr:hypothetical protein BGLA2_990010 [Burkholderia gladioli]
MIGLFAFRLPPFFPAPPCLAAVQKGCRKIEKYRPDRPFRPKKPLVTPSRAV